MASHKSPYGNYQTATIDGWGFKRVSAAYIDVTPPGSSKAVDCINVYDYEAGEPVIPFHTERSIFRGVCQKWLTDNKDDLHHYREMGR